MATASTGLDAIPAATICQVAEDGSHSDLPCNNAKYDLSHRSVKRIIAAHAHTVVLSELLVAEVALEELANDPPIWCQSAAQWDETLQRHKFRFEKLNITQSVQVFVSKLVISWGWGDGRPPHFLEVSLPCFPVASTAWSDIRDAMQSHYFTRPWWRVIKLLCGLTSRFKFRFGVTDHASGNEKYQAIERSDLCGVCNVDYIWCLNHKTMTGNSPPPHPTHPPTPPPTPRNPNPCRVVYI